jgi:opacity protein-like surface antigen
MLRIVVAGVVSAVALTASANADGFKDAAAPYSTWAGSYGGVYGGYGFGQASETSSIANMPNVSASPVAGGLPFTNVTALPWPAAGGTYNPQSLTVNYGPNAGTPNTSAEYWVTASPSQAVINKAQSPNIETAGLDIGGTAGHNWQSGSWVLGVEGSFGAFHLSGTANNSTPSGDFSGFIGTPGGGLPPVTTSSSANPLVLNQNAVTSNTTVDTDWLATVRGRLGYTTGRALFYGTAGVAFTQVNLTQHTNYSNGGTILTSANTNLASFNNAFANTGVFNNLANENTSSSNTATGWTAGGGVEYKLGGNWSGKLEYLYLDFGSVDANGTVYTPGGATVTTVHHSVDLQSNVVQAGLNYHFGNSFQPLQ